MENLNYTEAGFSKGKVIPESQNELTFLWGRAIANNLLNAYGLIGTIDTTGFTPADVNWKYQVFNMQLTKLFNYPPTIYFYGYDAGGLGIYSYLGEHLIRYQINGDHVAVIVPTYNHSVDTIFYRIMG